jgi:hypothetical protein
MGINGRNTSLTVNRVVSPVIARERFNHIKPEKQTRAIFVDSLAALKNEDRVCTTKSSFAWSLR